MEDRPLSELPICEEGVVAYTGKVGSGTDQMNTITTKQGHAAAGPGSNSSSPPRSGASSFHSSVQSSRRTSRASSIPSAGGVNNNVSTSAPVASEKNLLAVPTKKKKSKRPSSDRGAAAGSAQGSAAGSAQGSARSSRGGTPKGGKRPIGSAGVTDSALKGSTPTGPGAKPGTPQGQAHLSKELIKTHITNQSVFYSSSGNNKRWFRDTTSACSSGNSSRRMSEAIISGPGVGRARTPSPRAVSPVPGSPRSGKKTDSPRNNMQINSRTSWPSLLFH